MSNCHNSYLINAGKWQRIWVCSFSNILREASRKKRLYHPVSTLLRSACICEAQTSHRPLKTLSTALQYTRRRSRNWRLIWFVKWITIQYNSLLLHINAKSLRLHVLQGIQAKLVSYCRKQRPRRHACVLCVERRKSLDTTQSFHLDNIIVTIAKIVGINL